MVIQGLFWGHIFYNLMIYYYRVGNNLLIRLLVTCFMLGYNIILIKGCISLVWILITILILRGWIIYKKISIKEIRNIAQKIMGQFYLQIVLFEILWIGFIYLIILWGNVEFDLGYLMFLEFLFFMALIDNGITYETKVEPLKMCLSKILGKMKNHRTLKKEELERE